MKRTDRSWASPAPWRKRWSLSPFIESERGRGIGSLLLDKLKDEMGILEVSVYTKNKGALTFFQKNEFKAKDIQIESSTGEEIVLLNW